MDSDLTQAFRALSIPSRLALMVRLRERPLTCLESPHSNRCEGKGSHCGLDDLADELDVEPVTLARDLDALRRTGLIESNRNGSQISLRVNTRRVEQLRQFLDSRSTPR